MRARGSASATIFGTPYAAGCADGARAGRFNADVLAMCDRALSTENLERTQIAHTRLNRGAVRLRMGDAQGALEDFDQAIALLPRSPEAMINRGVALVMLKRHGEAVATLTRALQLKPIAPETAYYYRATAREGLNDIRGAFEDYNTALLIKPDWALVAADMARFARIRRDQLASTLGENGTGAP